MYNKKGEENYFSLLLRHYIADAKVYADCAYNQYYKRYNNLIS